jgi:uncharacterized protein (DUF697 family)
MAGWGRPLGRYPLLAVGLVGCGLLLVWQGLGHGLGLGVGIVSAVLVLLLLRQRWSERAPAAASPPEHPRLTRAAVLSYLDQVAQELQELEQELGEPQPDLQAAYQRCCQALEMPCSVAWAGTLTSLALPGEMVPTDSDHPAWVLYGVNAPLTPTQIQSLAAYQQQDQPVQVVWCDPPWQATDQYARVSEQLRALGYAQPLLSISLQPTAILVRRMQPDGSWEESWEIPPPVLDELTQWLTQRCQEPHWQYQAVVRRGKGLQTSIQKRQQSYRHQQARRVIHRYQVWAAVWAGVNPVASLDLLATGAINAQMLVDLAQVYRRPLTLNQAKEMVRALGMLLLRMGAVEAITQLAGMWLKSQVATYGLGSAVQALSAAYLTHLAGHTFLETLQQPERELNPGVWQSLRMRVLARSAALHFWQRFIPQSLPWLVPAGG